jgi:hypothetical protein
MPLFLSCTIDAGTMYRHDRPSWKEIQNQHRSIWSTLRREADNSSWNPRTCIEALGFIHVRHSQRHLLKMHAGSGAICPEFWEGGVFIKHAREESIRLCGSYRTNPCRNMAGKKSSHY